MTNDYAGGAAVFARLMELDDLRTAIVAPTDVIAIGLLHAAQERGLVVPDDVSVVGFDDIAVARYCVPALTTVPMLTEPMTSAALDLVINSHEGIRPDEHPVFEPALVLRASTGPAPT
jgi:DNA-binding LacI/PurR family transcriptional regulator